MPLVQELRRFRMQKRAQVAWLSLVCMLVGGAFAQSASILASIKPRGPSGNAVLSTNATSPTPTTLAEPGATLPPVPVTVSPKIAAVTVNTQTQQFTSSATN